MMLSRFVRNERGTAMVEMAIVLPIIILFFLGMIDFGRAIFLYNNLTNAAREGARFGASQVQGGSTPPAPGPIQDTTKVRIVDFSGQPLDATASIVATTTISKITVTITNYSFKPITPLPMVSSLKLNVKAVFRYEAAP